MKVVKRGLFTILAGLLFVVSFSAMVIGGTEVSGLTATAGYFSMTAKEFIEKTGFQIQEEEANNALTFAKELMSYHKFSLEQASGVLAVAYRESRFDVKAVNPSGGVAGFFQWSGWDSQINGNRWARASKKELSLNVQVDLMTTELEGDWKKVVDNMANAKSPYEAAKVWSKDYEGVSLDDGQSKLSDVEEWSKTIYEALKSARTASFDGVGSSASIVSVPDGWSVSNPYNGKNYNTSGSYDFGQCTWYVYNRAAQLGLSYDDYMGNGGDWWQKSGFRATKTPRKHVALSLPAGTFYGTYGHVCFVEEIKSDGSLLVSEMNMLGVPSGTASYRVISAEHAQQGWFVLPK